MKKEYESPKVTKLSYDYKEVVTSSYNPSDNPAGKGFARHGCTSGHPSGKTFSNHKNGCF